jgi:molybdate transport system substrate-binding protein
MRKGRFMEEQMVAIIREADREPVSAVAKRHGVSEQTIYTWRKRFGGLQATDIRRVRQLEHHSSAYSSRYATARYKSPCWAGDTEQDDFYEYRIIHSVRYNRRVVRRATLHGGGRDDGADVMAHKLLSITLAVVVVLITAASAKAAEIRVLSANGARLMLEALVPQFESETNHRVTTEYGEAGVLRGRILEGEDFDVTVLPSGWAELRGMIADDPVAIAHTDFGMAVLADVPTPDTSSSDALKQMLLSAKSIVYTDPKTGGISGVLFSRLIERLGIADEVNKKSKLVAGVLNVSFVVNGEADLAVELANEILAVPGVQFVPMPPGFQISVTFSGAVAAKAVDPAAAKSLISFLARPAAAPVIRSKGYEPG